MFYPTPNQMRTIESNSEKNGLPCRELMEAAGDALAMQICQIGLDISLSSGTVFICGSGNNGGDGFVAARLIAEIGFLSITGDERDRVALVDQAYCRLHLPFLYL